MTKQRSGRKKMKPWYGWLIVDGDGNHVTTPLSTFQDVSEDLGAWKMNGKTDYTIARVLVTELRTKRKGKK